MEWLKKILETAVASEEGINVDNVVDAIKKELPKNFVPKVEYNRVVEARDKFSGELEGLKQSDASGTIDTLNKRISDLEAKQKDDAVKYAITLAAKDAGMRDIDIASLLIDKEKLKVGEDGIEGISEQLEALRTEKAYLFGEPDKLGGREPNKGDGNPTGISKETFNGMGYKERVNLYNTNPELYKTLSEGEQICQ